jgi:hypothetical protein
MAYDSVLLHLSQPPLPLAHRLMQSTTMNVFVTPLILLANGSNVAIDRDALVAGANGNKDGRLGTGSLLCRGICNSFFGSTLTFAVKSMQHTDNHLQQWAREPDFRVRSFTCSILSTSQSACHSYHGVVLDRGSSPQEGFIFAMVQLLYLKDQLEEKNGQSNELIVKCTWKQAMKTKVSMNPDFVAMEICTTQEEIRVASLIVRF